jgi:uncharacterized protein YuzE
MTGTFESKEIYNEKGELIESYNFLGEKTLISLDKNGKIAKSTQYDENGIDQA